VRQAIAEDGFSVDLVTRIMREHGASSVAAAIQAAVCAPIACYVVICDYGTTTRFYSPRTGLFIEYASRSRSNRYAMSRFLSVPSDHLFYEAWKQQADLEGSTYVPKRDGSTSWSCDGEARFLNGRVLGTLLLERPVKPNPNQLALI
jgi:hypothetical protein